MHAHVTHEHMSISTTSYITHTAYIHAHMRVRASPAFMHARTSASLASSGMALLSSSRSGGGGPTMKPSSSSPSSPPSTP